MNFSVPATSANLGSGFDTLGLSLNLRNYFSISFCSKRKVSVRGEGSDIPSTRNNSSFVKIFTKIYADLSKGSEFSFKFRNFIPISRGLGSSSAMVVGAIFSAYKLAGLIPIKQDILNIALQYEKHPDNITSAVFGGFNASFIHEENGKKTVVSVRKRMPKDLVAVLVIPSRPVSTRLARKVLPETYSNSDAVFSLSRSSVLSAAFFAQDWSLLKLASMDRLHESYRISTMPILSRVQKYSLSNGALMSTLSGSGSSIFNLCYADDGGSLKSALIKKFPFFRILMVDFDNDGVKIEKDF